MREVVLDTETTGLDPTQGHRVVEIACVELDELLPTGAHFHTYVNPDREMDAGAQRVHGLSTAFLANKPRFADPAVIEALLAFIGDAPLVAHNAGFDRSFLNWELRLAGRPPIPQERWIDSLALAQNRHRGKVNSLDALCARYGVSLSERVKHGALIDAKLLAQVYLELRGGRERRLDLAMMKAAAQSAALERRGPRPMPLLSRLTAPEAAAHAAFVAETLGGRAIWAGLVPDQPD